MSWMNVRVDKDLVRRVMDRHNLRTTREAVEFALRRAAVPYDADAILALQGSGWEGDLEQMRRTRNLEC